MLFPETAPADPSFVGMAKLARSGDVLEQKRTVRYAELPTRSYVSRCSSPRMPFGYTVNPYRGCEFGCKYCYARYTHEFMELRGVDDFEKQIFAKQFDAERFRAELRRLRQGEHVAIGTATDPYQPAERRFGITRKMLEVLRTERGLRLSITTKSDLVARDAELLAALGRRHIVFVHLTITTLDDGLARLLEPGAPRPELRLRALATLRRAGVHAGAFASPLLPAINDGEAQLRALAAEVKAAGGLYFSGAPLFLKPCATRVFLPFLRQSYPALATAYEAQFAKETYLPEAMKERMRERMGRIREEAGLRAQPVEYQPEEWSREPWQPGLFEEAGGAEPSAPPLPVLRESVFPDAA